MTIMPSLSVSGQISQLRGRYIELRPALFIQWLCFGLLMGLLLRLSGGVDWWLIVSIGVSFLVLVKRYSWIGLAGVALIGLGLGMGRAQGEWRQFVIYDEYVGQEITIKGRLAEDGIYNERGQRQLLLDDIYLLDNQRELPGRIQVTTFSEARYLRGDVVEVSGTLRDRFGNRAGYIY